MKKNNNKFLLIAEIFAIISCILFMVPVFLVIMNSFKTNGEIMGNFFSWMPSGFHWENFTESFKKMNYPRAFMNTLFITVGTVVGSVVFGSIASYKLCRTKTKYSRVVFYICISPLLITFSSIMISVTQIAKTLGLLNKVWGMIIIYLGFNLPFTIFMYHGSFKTIPLEIEEAARIDGCNTVQTFVKVVFPLLKPITTTVSIITSMRIWNDYLGPLIIIGTKQATHTLMLAADRFRGGKVSNYAACMAVFIMVSLPITIFYLFMQKHIVEGIVVGAVKS